MNFKIGLILLVLITSPYWIPIRLIQAICLGIIYVFRKIDKIMGSLLIPLQISVRTLRKYTQTNDLNDAIIRKRGNAQIIKRK